jgi:hypothetical protein
MPPMPFGSEQFPRRRSSRRRFAVSGPRSWALWVFTALGWLMPITALFAAVEFPGPRLTALSQPGHSVLAVRLPDRATDDLLVGGGGGLLSLVGYTDVSRAFAVRQQLNLGGRLVGLVPWEGLPLSEQGVVVAAADPDRVFFVRIQPTDPYLTLAESVDLDEDPGTLAWFGDVNGGRGQVAVSLPGIDVIALLADEGGWRLRQSVAVGDEPRSLTSADLDGDGVLEVVAAQCGWLSGDLAVLTAADDQRAVVRFARIADLNAGLVAAFDDDGDGRHELAVADRDQPVVRFLRARDLDFDSIGEIALTIPARNLVMWTLADGSPALLAENEERGTIDFSSRTAAGWVQHDTFFPGCRPLASAPAELNGDGQPDLATVGAGTAVMSLMFARSGPGFWAPPARVLTARAGGICHGDFDGDGHADVLIQAALEKRLSLFASRSDGKLQTMAREIPLSFLPGKSVAVELDGDRSPELAVLDVIAGQVVVLDLAADGGFTEGARQAIGSFPTFLTAGDIDADGLVDLLALPSSDSNVRLLFGAGDSAFSPPVTLIYDIATTRAVLVDLNGDGLLDVIGVDGVSRVWWCLNLGGRTFGPGQWLQAGAGASLLAAGDLDGDLDDDVVVGCRTDHSLVLFENNGLGDLVRRTGSFALGSEPRGLQIGDFNRDGRGDIAVNLRDEDRLEIYLSTFPWSNEHVLSVPGTPEMLEFLVADVNSDGMDDLLALDSLLQVCVAHLNLDPAGVALEPRSLMLSCADGRGLQVRLEPGLEGPWRLEAFLPAGWRTLVENGRAAVGELEFDGGVWILTIAADELTAWGRPSVLRLEVARSDGRLESHQEAVAAPCGPDAPDGGSALPVWLAGPWPNPGNPLIRARFHLPRDGYTRVAVHDLTGRRVAVLADGNLPAGDHEVRWNGRGPGGAAAAGAYLFRIETPSGCLSRKLVLLK